MKATSQFVRHVVTTLAVVLIFNAAPAAFASGGGGQLLKANNELENTSSLQRGARNYMNYCLGCHSLNYMRYNRIAEDLGLSESQLQQSLIFGADRINDNVTTAMTKEQGAEWFAAAPGQAVRRPVR